MHAAASEQLTDSAALDASTEIEITDLTVSYGGVVAVKNLSLSIRRGEMLVLLGPSGCGKTSTMRSIVGLETPVGGSIRMGGRVLFDAAKGINVPANRRDMGMVFQSYAIWPHKTVFQNVAFPLRMKRLPRSEIADRVTEALEKVGMRDLGPRPASRLSGGQMQRVALARSLVARPRVLLLDEPLSNLDAKLRDRLRFELKAIQQEVDVTSVYVTHDQSEALVLADRVAVMNDGMILQIDSPDQVYDHPASTFVADFLGISNIFPATVETATPAGPLTLRLAGGTVVDAYGDAEIGQRVTACVRPDAISLSALDSPSQPVANAWAGTVAAASFVGTHRRYYVDLDQGESLDVIAYGRTNPFARGDRIRLGVDPADVRVLGK